MGLVFDGASVIYVTSVLIFLLISMIIFVQRQIYRHRNNAARVKPQISLSHRISNKKTIQLRQKQLENVVRLRNENQARLTDCVALQFHSDKPYVHRMIAVDEVSLEIDGLLQRIEGAIHRKPGESTYLYLQRIREKVPSIPTNLIVRISFLQEAARYRPEKFDVEHVMELRSLLNKFMKILSEDYSSLQDEPNELSGSRGVVSSFYQLGQKIIPHNAGSKRRRNKFGGSDGVRLLFNKEREESAPLLSPLAGGATMTGTSDSPLRRQSESHHSLLQNQ